MLSVAGVLCSFMYGLALYGDVHDGSCHQKDIGLTLCFVQLMCHDEVEHSHQQTGGGGGGWGG